MHLDYLGWDAMNIRRPPTKKPGDHSPGPFVIGGGGGSRTRAHWALPRASEGQL